MTKDDENNAGARGPPVIILCVLSFSSDFDRRTYELSEQPIHQGFRGPLGGLQIETEI